MGVDDEYKMVSSQDEANDHLLDRSAPISRSSYRKRNMFASIAVGVIIGAAAMFLLSFLFGPVNKTLQKEVEPPKEPAPEVAPVTVTSTATETATVTRAPVPTLTQVLSGGALKDHKYQVGVDVDHIITPGIIADCGHTVEEARAKDCVFDVMMQDWMPRPCYDEALSERYLATGNWTWWADAEATRSLSLEEMRRGEHPVIFVVQDYHRSHCIFAWEKMVRALRNDWPLIEELISYDHVMHCRHSTLSKASETVRGVRAPTAWTRCALIEDWQGHFPANSVSSIDKRFAEMEFESMMIDA